MVLLVVLLVVVQVVEWNLAEVVYGWATENYAKHVVVAPTLETKQLDEAIQVEVVLPLQQQPLPPYEVV